MEEERDDRLAKPKSQPLVSDKPDAEKLFRSLRERFEPLAATLTHEEEPSFRFQP